MPLREPLEVRLVDSASVDGSKVRADFGVSGSMKLVPQTRSRSQPHRNVGSAPLSDPMSAAEANNAC